MSEQKQNPIEAGAIFIVTSGEYSNFGVDDVYRALVRIEDPDAIMAPFWWEEANSFYGRSSVYQYFDREALITHLLTSGMIEEVPHTKWWMP